MKNFRKRLTAVCSAAAVALSMCGSIPIGSLLPDAGMLTASAAVKTQCETYSGSNVDDQSYIQWASPIDSYLTALDSGGFMRFQNGAVEGKYLIEYYDKDYNIQETIQLDAELPLFGGFYETEDYYFVLSGEQDYGELRTVESYRITKYNKEWNRLDSVGMMDCNTAGPFEAGSARFAVCGNYLLIRTCHEMYQSSDGYNHQANVTIQLDMESMEITDSYTKVMNSTYGSVSHSFNQFIHVEDNRIIALDHGDANPRSLLLTKYNTDLTTGTFTPDYKTTCDLVSIVTFPGSDTYHYNFTGASVGGFEISETSYLAAYAAENFEDDNLDNGTRNIVVGVVNKETDAVQNIQITNYEEGAESASTPHLVKVSDNSFILLWSHEDDVHYTALDGEGNPGEIYTIEDATLSDCVPVIADGELVWYTWSNKVNTFCDIDLTDLSQHSQTVIENGHRTEFISVPTEAGGECSVHCTQCDQDFTFATPESMSVNWTTPGSNFASSTIPTVYKDDTLEYWISFSGEYDTLFHDYEVTFSDPEHAVLDRISSRVGQITFLKEGIYTITFTHLYNPVLTKTVTIKVLHDPDHTLDITPLEEGSNLAEAVCQDCDYTDTLTVASSFYVNWKQEGETYYSSYFYNPNCPDSEILFSAFTREDAYLCDMTVEIIDPDIAEVTSAAPLASGTRGTIVSAVMRSSEKNRISLRKNPQDSASTASTNASIRQEISHWRTAGMPISAMSVV